MPSSDVRSRETSAQNARGKNFQSPRVQIFAVSYFAVLIFAFWSWVTKIAKIWTSRKFSAIRYQFLHSWQSINQSISLSIFACMAINQSRFACMVEGRTITAHGTVDVSVEIKNTNVN